MADFGRRKSDRFSIQEELSYYEKAIQLIEQYYNAQAKSLKKIGKEQQELFKEMDRYDAKLAKMNINIQNKDDVKKVREQYENVKRRYELSLKEIEVNKQRNRLAEVLNGKTLNQVKAQEQINKAMEDAVKIASDLTKSEEEREKLLLSQAKIINDKQRTINKTEAKKSAIETMLGSLSGSDNFSADLEDMNNGVFAIKKGAEIFAKAVGVFKEAVKSSITKNYETTESTLNKITASNRISWSSGSFKLDGKSYTGSSQLNNAINDKLWSEGLYDNIANTDIVEAVTKLTTEGGMDLEKALAKGYEDTVIKYIVPYLDTASETFTNLDFLMPGMSKSVAAIAITTRDQIGESRYLSKYAEELAQLLEPVSLQASEELYSEEFQSLAAMTEAMLDAKLFSSAAEARKYLHQAFGIYNNFSGKLSNGTTIEKWAAIDALQSGNQDSPFGIFNALVGNTKEAFSWAHGDSVTGSIIQNAFGTNSYRNMNIENWNAAQKIMNDFQSKSYDELLEIYDIEKSNADDYNTNSDKVNKLLINATADIGDIKSVITDKGWTIGSVIVGGIVSGITGWLATKLIGGVIGKGISALSGISGEGVAAIKSSGGILGTAGSMVTGIAATVAAIGVIAKIGDSINSQLLSKQKMSASTNSTLFTTEVKEELSGTKLENNNAAIATKSAGEGYGAGKSDWRTIYDRTKSDIASDWWADVKGSWGNWADKTWFFNNPSKRDAQEYNEWLLGMYLNENHSLTNSDDYMHLMLAYYALMASQGLNGNYTNNADVNDTNVKQYINDALNNDDVFSGYGSALQTLQTEGIVDKYGIPISDNFKDIQLKIFDWASHRQGLDTVPYDNYLASLHQGEAILTASTANELRNLLDEYRSNTHIGANLDVIIQQQTVTLCNKLDEVVRAVNMSNVGSISTASSEYQARAHNLLRTSMLTMKNTKDALS